MHGRACGERLVRGSGTVRVGVLSTSSRLAKRDCQQLQKMQKKINGISPFSQLRKRCRLGGNRIVLTLESLIHPTNMFIRISNQLMNWKKLRANLTIFFDSLQQELLGIFRISNLTRKQGISPKTSWTERTLAVMAPPIDVAPHLDFSGDDADRDVAIVLWIYNNGAAVKPRRSVKLKWRWERINHIHTSLGAKG